jgi:RNA polymerase subunit RPABC4/transcription elongation factor Spt4
MSRFNEELRIIPRTAWILAITFYLILANLSYFVLTVNDKRIQHWPVEGRFAFSYGIFLLAVVWIALIGYVHADAKRRGMRYIMWTCLAILVPDGIGIILYFALRDPMPRNCPRCTTSVNASFAFCPHCGVAMRPTCSNCGRTVEPGWANCPHCGSKLPTQSPAA